MPTPRLTERIRAFGGALLAAVVTGCASAPGLDVGRIPPGVDLAVRVVHYPVSSATVRELRQEMREVGPDYGGRRWAGVTNTHVRWNYRYTRRGWACEIRDARVVVSGEVRLPRWKPETVPDSATLAWWHTFSANLFEHERGHVRIALDGAQQIADALRGMQGAGSCDALGLRANGTAQSILLSTRRRQVEYDRETGHGARPAADTLRM